MRFVKTSINLKTACNLLLISIVPACLFIALVSSPGITGEEAPVWSSNEWQTIQSLTLNNLQKSNDKSNQFLHNSDAIILGKQLFFENRLSKTGQVSCATCHRPDKYFTDGRVIALGQDIGKRNTPSLHGVSYNTWFFWDGRKDSLWSQALAPLENPVEHNFSRTQVAKLILEDEAYQSSYRKIFGLGNTIEQIKLPDDAKPSGTIEQIKAWKKTPPAVRQATDQIFANTGKALAAFVNTLKPLHSRFDDYVNAYNQGDHQNQHLNDTELAGLRLFINEKSQCINCHFGPLFTNQSFHNIGTGMARVDSGRATVIDQLRIDRFNCLGKYSDAPEEGCPELQFMQRDRHELWGAFKTPTLRNVSNTAPYFHDGRSASLESVIEHYTQLDADKTHMQALVLTEKERNDLAAFLNALAATKDISP